MQVEAIYIEEREWLLGWYRRRLDIKDHAMDLVQDTFLKVLVSGAGGTIANPRGFLTTLARQVLVDRLRRQTLEAAYLEMLAAMPAQHAPSAEALAITRQTLVAIDRMLAGLPQPVRDALLLSQLEGLGYAEIADRLGVSERTVKRYMAQGFEACLLAMD